MLTKLVNTLPETGAIASSGPHQFSCFLLCTHLTAGVPCWVTFSAGVSVKWTVLLCCLHHPLCNRQVGGSNVRSREGSFIPWGLWAIILICVAGFWSFVIRHFPPDRWVMAVSIFVSISVRRCRRSSGSLLLFGSAWLLAMRLHRSPVFSVGSSWFLWIGTCFLSTHTQTRKKHQLFDMKEHIERKQSTE